jgi:hypothetical protein
MEDCQNQSKKILMSVSGGEEWKNEDKGEQPSKETQQGTARGISHQVACFWGELA